MKFFKPKDLKEEIKKVVNSSTIHKKDDDIARLKAFADVIATIQQSQPQVNSGNFMSQMLEFEKIKGVMAGVEEVKIAKIRSEIEQEYDNSEGDMKPDDIMKVLAGVLQPKEQQKPQDPFAPATFFDPNTPAPQAVQGSPMVGERLPEPAQLIPPLPELNMLEKKAVTIAVKKIPKVAKNAFKGLSEDKREAVIDAIMDQIEQE